MKRLAAFLASFVLLTVAHAGAPAWAADEEDYLSPAISEAWARYLAARQAGDMQAAGDAAIDAHRAAERDGADAMTRAILADTAGQFAFLRQDHAGARAMLDLAASLYGGMDESHLNSRVRVMTLAANTSYNEDNLRDALNRVNQALAAAGPSGVDADRDREIAEALVVRARSQWRQSALSDAGLSASEALELMEPHGYGTFTFSSLMAFYVGVESVIRGRNPDSAWWFAVADHQFRQQGQGGHLSTVSDVWSRYARSRLTSGQRRELIVRLAEAGYISAPAREAAETELAEAEQEEERESAAPDPNNRPARPLNRRAPDYPQNAAAAGVEGVALVTFTVGENGRVRDVEVVFSAPHPVFGEAAVRAVRTWRYEPKLVDGVPTAHEGVQTTLDFRMMD
jgi:TonB family protein